MTLAGHTGGCVRRRRSTRRPSTILAHRAARAYPVAVPFLVSPPFHPRPQAHAELGRAELAAVRSADHPSPLRLDSPRPEPSSLAVHRLHSTPFPFEPNPGRIERFHRDRHCCSSRTPPHAVELPLRGLLRPNQAQGEHSRTLLALPESLPTRIRGRRRRFAAAPPQTC